MPLLRKPCAFRGILRALSVALGWGVALLSPHPLVLTPPAHEHGSARRYARQLAAPENPGRPLRVLLLAAVVGGCLRNFRAYSRSEHANPDGYLAFVQGRGLAPEQYRPGVKWLAWLVMRASGMHFRHAFALLDLLFASAAVLLLCDLLENTLTFRRAGRAGQCFAAACLLAISLLSLSWLSWFEKPETLPAVGLVAGLLFLWTRPSNASQALGGGGTSAGLGAPWPRAAALILTTLALALVRADVALALCGGMCLVAAGRHGPGLALRRTAAICTSGAGLFLSAGVQLYLMLRAFPLANYGRTPVLMGRHDLTKPLVLVPFFLFMLPFAWTAWHLRRFGARAESASVGLLLGGLLYLPLWMALGKVDEVRIFLPFALSLGPLTAEMAILRWLPTGFRDHEV